MCDIDELARKWQQCWPDVSIYLPDRDSEKQQTIGRIFQILVTAYSKPDRHYHTLNHIDHFLTILEQFTLRIQDPIAVYLAVWFHDFIYDSHASDNEIQSAKAAREFLTDIGESSDLIDRVQQLILATQGHQIDANDSDRSIFLDADLAILGADPDRYQTYARSIRCEYNWVSDSAYKAGRIQVLETFLQRDRLYYTDLLFTELESKARHNMKREISILERVEHRG